MNVTVVAQPQKKLSELSDLAPQIDEVGELAAKMEKIEAQIQERTRTLQEKLAALREEYEPKLAELTDQINDLLDDADPDKPFVGLGNRYRAKVSPQGTVRIVEDIKLVAQLLNKIMPDLFWELARVKIKDRDEYLTPDQREAVLGTKRTPRKVVVVKRVV
jgi:division protein CdvB (Snf7/Vps24/ESCRT-III family)